MNIRPQQETPTANTAQQQETPPAIAAHDFHETILREYDIRGLVGKTVSEDDAYALGAAYGTFLRSKAERPSAPDLWVCVGYDGRFTSPALEEALVKGLTHVGINVERLGVGPTPMTYFAKMDHMRDGAIMVTGSHNPPEYNGFKMVLQDGSVYGDMIQTIGDIAREGAYFKADAVGTTRHVDITDSYVKRLLKDYEGGKPLKVVWDAGNGAAGDVLQKLVAQLPGEHILLYETIDGAFPNHHPDPTVDKNLQDLIKAVREHNADMGIAFDGDADRIGAVDGKGRIIRCDTLLMIYAREVLEDYPGAPIIGDVKCSQTFYDQVKKLGGQPVMSKTGHSLVKAKLAELKSPLAGELSGHIFFADKYYGFDDALYCGIRLMNEVSTGEDSLADILDSLPQLVSTPEIRIQIDEDKKFALIDDLHDAVKQEAEANGASVITIDGLRYEDERGWWLLRASNTQDCIVTRIEAKSDQDLQDLSAALEAHLKTYGLSLEDAL